MISWAFSIIQTKKEKKQEKFQNTQSQYFCFLWWHISVLWMLVILLLTSNVIIRWYNFWNFICYYQYLSTTDLHVPYTTYLCRHEILIMLPCAIIMLTTRGNMLTYKLYIIQLHNNFDMQLIYLPSCEYGRWIC